MSKKFWSEWVEADELKRLELISKLTMPVKKKDDELLHHSAVTLLNSYLEDLEQFLMDNDDKHSLSKKFWKDQAIKKNNELKKLKATMQKSDKFRSDMVTENIELKKRLKNGKKT